MERKRLETEYKKLKELKKKAESFAVEAKQTAQRLSAENFKLKEDHNKEKHYNELTRKSVARDYELELARGGRVDVIREDVFREEVIKKAHQMIQDKTESGNVKGR